MKKSVSKIIAFMLILAMCALTFGCGKTPSETTVYTDEEGLEYTVIDSPPGTQARLYQLEPLEQYQMSGGGMEVYKEEKDFFRDSALIIRCSLVESNEYCIKQYFDEYPDQYQEYSGTVYDFKINEIYYSNEDFKEGDIIKLRSMFSSRAWNNLCIRFEKEKEYIIIVFKGKPTDDLVLQQMAQYGFGSMWHATICLEDGTYSFSPKFESLANDKADLKIRPDIYARHMEVNKEFYAELDSELSKGEIKQAEYKQKVEEKQDSLFKVYTRSDEGFIDSLKKTIEKYKD